MIFTTSTDRLNILASAIKAKEEEILYYTVNIDNYRLGIESVLAAFPTWATDAELARSIAETPAEDILRINAVTFARQLQNLLTENQLELAKTQIMLDVLMSQVEGIDIKSFYVAPTV